MSTVESASPLLTENVEMVELIHSSLDPADVVAGVPTTGMARLLSDRGVEIGIWEITSGIATDIEADEVFVVLSGRGRVDFDDGTSLLLTAGSVVRLRAGDRTTWTIYETLRKVYVLLPGIIEETTA